MKKFFIRLFILAFPVHFLFSIVAYVDVFNVFHWNNIRHTSAEPNKNFIKTRYIIKNPEKFNAFIFGSSRVGNLPLDFLPENYNGEKLNWYNMTYSEGIPDEHYESLKTFLKNNVKVKMVIVGIDDISCSKNPAEHKKELLRMSYQEFERNPLSYYGKYLVNFDGLFKIGKEVLKDKSDNSEFYAYDGSSDFSLNETPDMSRFDCSGPAYYKCKYEGAIEDLRKLVELCTQNNIKLYVFTSPLYAGTYLNAVKSGYLEYLSKVSEITDCYNFSCVNEITSDERYYFESSHYRPIVGAMVEKMMFGYECISGDFGRYVEQRK